MSDAKSGSPAHDELWTLVRKRLVEEGIAPARADALATALIEPDSRLDALEELEDRLEHLSDVVDRLSTRVEAAADSLEHSSAGMEQRTDGHPAAEAPSPPVAGNGESSIRHPIRAMEHEAEHLREVATRGEDETTPAIVVGGVMMFLIPIVALVLALTLGVTYLVTHGSNSAGPVSAPAFTADELAASPTDNWITNGGSLSNQRYSPLDEITSANVSELKGVWHIHLRGSGTAAKYSAESQPIVYKGTIYVPTGQDDVFAVDAASGKVLWEHKANLNQKISTVCCGWLSRGVALGDGKVYIGQLDGYLVALDQQTGKVVWKTLVMPWQRGYSITSAPLYYDGLVITGASGGEFGIRGRLTAYDAKTGKEAWRFYTIPGPGQPGHDTWPQTGDAWKHGGAPVWQTPSVDPKLGLLYFSTGNAGPDNDGSKRAGKNLFAASIVALDARTGKLRWHYQMVHHDLWDYDAPSPTVLFDALIGGRLRHGIGEAEKTGWLYLLDRTNGKPLFPTPETSVPQEPRQKTWPTQPIPSYPPFVPHAVSEAQYRQVAKQAEQAAGHAVRTLRATRIYTPYWKTPVIMTPGPQGGTNWQPSSYNPDTGMFYVCAQSGPAAYTAETEKPAKQGAVATTQLGSTLTVAGGFGSNAGYFSAIDATTGRIAWQKRWPESCYAGSATTAGNLVFVGRSSGLLQAYDARTGKQLWSFQTGTGANNAPTIFQRNGTQYVVFYAGGNALAASPHGDDLWLFSLNGKLGPAAAPGSGQGVEHAGATPQKSTAGNATAGRATFESNCSTCHGATGRGGNGGPDLTTIPSAKNLQTVIAQVTNGGGGMPSFKRSLTDQEIRDVATFVTTKITK
jgi:quinohemoprotein ethanol dehydrogenase